jgi:hypothetical protein
MGQTTDRIEHHIDATREELGYHIHELQDRARKTVDRARNAVDWRYQVNERPWAIMGVAFGVGLAAALVIRRSDSGASRWRPSGQSSAESTTSQVWNNIRNAAGAAILGKVKDATRDVVPGFWEQYDRQDSRRRAARAATDPDISDAAI